MSITCQEFSRICEGILKANEHADIWDVRRVFSGPNPTRIPLDLFPSRKEFYFVVSGPQEARADPLGSQQSDVLA